MAPVRVTRSQLNGAEENTARNAKSEKPRLSRDIDRFVQGIYSNDPDIVSANASKLDDLFRSDKSSISRFVDLNAVSKLMELLLLDARPDIQICASRMLYQMLAGTTEQVDCVVGAGVCSIFVKLLDSDSSDVVREAAWALSLIALKRPQLRELLVQLGSVSVLTRLVNCNTPQSLLLAIVQCVSTISACEVASLPPGVITTCLPALKRLLMHESEAPVLGACMSLGRIIRETGRDFIEQLEKLGVLDVLVELVNVWRCNGKILQALLKTIDCIVENGAQSPAVTRHGVAPPKEVVGSLKGQKALWDSLAEKGLVRHLEAMQSSDDKEIACRAVKLMHSYWVTKSSYDNESEPNAWVADSKWVSVADYISTRNFVYLLFLVILYFVLYIFYKTFMCIR